MAIRGVILNRVAGSRHESILRRSIEHYSGLPVIGAVPKLGRQIFPERHMGLVPTPEHGWAADSIQSIARIAAQHIDLAALTRIAREAAPMGDTCISSDFVRLTGRPADRRPPSTRIGILRDSAFQFYYPENIEALEAALQRAGEEARPTAAPGAEPGGAEQTQRDVAIPAANTLAEGSEPFSWERFIGQKTMGWVAVVLLVFAAAFFLRYAYQNNWVGPVGRVAIGALLGAAARGYADRVELLLAAGADPAATDDHGWNALRYAQRREPSKAQQAIVAMVIDRAHGKEALQASRDIRQGRH